MKKRLAGIMLGLSLAVASIEAGLGGSRERVGEDLSLDVNSNLFNTPSEETSARPLTLRQAIQANDHDAVVAALQRGEDPFLPDDLLHDAFEQPCNAGLNLPHHSPSGIIHTLANAECEGTRFPLAYVVLLAIRYNRPDGLLFFSPNELAQLDGEVMSICMPFAKDGARRIAVQGSEIFSVSELPVYARDISGWCGNIMLADYALIRENWKMFDFLTQEVGLSFSSACKLFDIGVQSYFVRKTCIARERRERASQTPQ